MVDDQQIEIVRVDIFFVVSRACMNISFIITVRSFFAHDIVVWVLRIMLISKFGMINIFGAHGVVSFKDTSIVCVHF